MRRWLAVIGLAALAGVVATGVVVARRRREYHPYDNTEIRRRLHERHAAAVQAA